MNTHRLPPDRIQECLDLEAEWCKVNNCDQQEGQAMNVAPRFMLFTTSRHSD